MKKSYTNAVRHRNRERARIVNLLEAHRDMLQKIRQLDYSSLTYKVLEELLRQIRAGVHRGGRAP